MNLDNALALTLREACEHTAGAERAESLGGMQELDNRAVKTLEMIDCASLGTEPRGVIESAIRYARNVQRAVHPEVGGMTPGEAQQLIVGLLG